MVAASIALAPPVVQSPLHAWLLRAPIRYPDHGMARGGDDDRDDAVAADVAIVNAAQRGDTRAEAMLLQRIVPHARVIARTILPPADADDGFQVALMRIFDGLSSYRGQGSLDGWARRVATHACLRLREQNSRRAQLVDPHAEPEPVSVVVERLGEGLPRHVAEYLDELPEVQRQVLVLRHVLDYSVAEIAEMVGAPIDTVKSRLLYARRALRKSIRRDRILPKQAQGGSGR
jgi:RNA polymerase sigma-70 factor (ECF subfamily)